MQYNICSGIGQTFPMQYNICSGIGQTSPIQYNICSGIGQTSPMQYNSCSGISQNILNSFVSIYVLRRQIYEIIFKKNIFVYFEKPDAKFTCVHVAFARC
jgi:hypothetical protein